MAGPASAEPVEAEVFDLDMDVEPAGGTDDGAIELEVDDAPAFMLSVAAPFAVPDLFTPP